MFVRFLMMINNNFVPLKTSFLKHIRQEVLVNVVIKVLDRDLNRWRLPDIIFVDYEPGKSGSDKIMD